MSNVVVYDPSDSVVANRVTEYRKSVNTPDYDGQANTLVNPNLSSVDGIDQKYWKYFGGDVVEMSTEEKTAVDESLNPNMDTFTINEMLTNGYHIDVGVVLRKINIEIFKVNTPEDAASKVYALAKKLEAGFVHLLNLISSDSVYLDMAKQYALDKKNESELTQEEYDFINGILNSTLPT